MANLHAELRLSLTENGIPDNSPLLDYLDWAGIRTKNSLAMFFTDTDKIIEWTEKFQNEITYGTPEKKIHFPENDRRKGLYKHVSLQHGTFAGMTSTQPETANYPHQHPYIRHRVYRLHPAQQMTRSPRPGPKESTNNS